MKFARIAAVLAALFGCSIAQAQTSGSVTNHAFAVGKGAGVTGYTSLLCTSAQLAVGQAAADPVCQTITGDVTISAGGVTAIGSGVVHNSMLNSDVFSAADTFTNKTINCANNTCTVRLGSDVTGNLPLTGLATGSLDQVIGYFGATTGNAIAINNCTGALTYSTTTHTFGCNSAAGTGTVTSVTCGNGLSGGTFTTTGTCALALTNTTLQASPTNPTGTTSATGVMMGLGTTCHLTPTYSGRVHITFTGSVKNSAATASSIIKLYYGNGTAPANAAAITGTQLGNSVQSDETTANFFVPFTLSGIITGLTPGTAYWFDNVLSSTGSNTATEATVSCNAFEF